MSSYIGNWRTRWRFRHIPGPPPTFPLGNMKTVIQKQIFRAHMDWSARYGDVFRMFMVQEPVIVVTGGWLSPTSSIVQHACVPHLPHLANLKANTEHRFCSPLNLNHLNAFQNLAASHCSCPGGCNIHSVTCSTSVVCRSSQCAPDHSQGVPQIQGQIHATIGQPGFPNKSTNSNPDINVDC